MDADATARANELIDLTAALTEVIEQENALLDSHRVGEIASLQPQKASLAELYEMRLRDMVQDRDQLSSLEPKLRQRLRTVSESFESATRHNVIALKAAMELNSRLVQTIAQSIENLRISPSGYTETGARRTVAGRGTPEPVPMTLDTEL